MRRVMLAGAVLCLHAVCGAAEPASFDAAAAFGARPSVSALTLSPDGQSLAWIAPSQGQGSIAYTLSLGKDAKPKPALAATGSPERLESCDWVSSDRLVCDVYLLATDATLGVLPFSRVVAVNADGSNPKQLSNEQTSRTHGLIQRGGEVIDWLPETDASVLMTRVYGATDKIGTHFGSTEVGLGVDEVNTRTRDSHRVEPPHRDTIDYISDGHGHVRIVANNELTGRGITGVIQYSFYPPGSRDLQPLSTYQSKDDSGFEPSAVDAEHNLVYGFKKLDGRMALYSVTLDPSRIEQLVYANPQVDVAGLLTLGRQHRVVGVSYYTESRHAEYFAPEVKSLVESLGRALHAPLQVVDASADESRLLVHTSTDTDPGVYYLFDKKSHQLQTLFVVRNQLEGVKLATVKPVTYAAADGNQIPAYLTLPPGAQSVKGLPAIVMPHGGPDSRDVWGFDWLAQFFANRGFAVLQPNFRGSWGYGEGWFAHNGFRSWKVAIGDVLDGGRWLVKEGADPGKLGIVGWSYGGYAALQSAVEDPALFKAVIAIAPVTDLSLLKEEHRRWNDFEYISEFVGEGPHVREGSPAQHGDRFRAPVLLFHGTMDRNVLIEQSQHMESALKSAGAKVTLVTFDGLDHQLEDSAVRTQMLSRSDRFLREAFGM
ncbi:MAG TPA: S9 family peptidase [Steroidobacteraceae bacterium]|jgi:acetyl esterase/lipase|nr:S9 family peptidase [Steroidobacteraceae bacterium]